MIGRASQERDDGALPVLRAEEAYEAVERTTRVYPYFSVVVALCVGVVLGGGLPAWVVRLLMMSGARLAAAHLVDAMSPSSEARSEPALGPLRVTETG